MKRVAALLLAVGAALAVAAAERAPGAAAPEAKGSLLFVRQRAARVLPRYDLYRADVRAQTCRRVLAVPLDGTLTVSPTGRHAALRVGKRLRLVSLPGGAGAVIATGAVSAETWSRDGQSLGFLVGERARIVRLPGARAAFSPPPGGPWSPDGTRVAFTRTTGNGRAGTLRTTLVVAPVGNPSAAKALFVEPHPYSSSPLPHWAPDSRTIYFPSDGFFAVDSASGQIRRTRNGFSGGTWSPDNSTVLFTGSGPHGVDDVFVMAADGTRQRRLTTSTPPPRGLQQAGSQAGTWSPDGHWISFGRKWEVAIMRADGSEKRTLCRLPRGLMPDQRQVWVSP